MSSYLYHPHFYFILQIWWLWRERQIPLNLRSQHRSWSWYLLRSLHETLYNDSLHFVKFDFRVYLSPRRFTPCLILCAWWFRNDVSQVPLVHKTNGKILQLIQAVDTSMLVAQIGYRLSSDAASVCDPFTPSTMMIATSNGSKSFSGLSLSEMLQTMAAHGHGHCLKTLETFRDVQQRLYKVRSVGGGVVVVGIDVCSQKLKQIAAATQDNETLVLVPPDPQQCGCYHFLPSCLLPNTAYWTWSCIF